MSKTFRIFVKPIIENFMKLKKYKATPKLDKRVAKLVENVDMWIESQNQIALTGRGWVTYDPEEYDERKDRIVSELREESKESKIEFFRKLIFNVYTLIAPATLISSSGPYDETVTFGMRVVVFLFVVVITFVVGLLLNLPYMLKHGDLFDGFWGSWGSWNLKKWLGEPRKEIVEKKYNLKLLGE